MMRIGVSRPARVSKAKKRRRDYAVPALDKSLDVLEALAAAAVPLSLTELAQTVGQRPSAVFRLLCRLEDRSYVIRDPVSGRYNLSLKLFELAHTHSPVEHIVSVSGRLMRELAASVKESVHLSMLSHGRLVVLLDIGSPLRVRFSHEIGGQFPPVLTNSGRLLLAYLSTEDLEDHLLRDPEYAQLSATERETFHGELKMIRRDHYAVSDSDERAGMKDLAVLVGNPAIGVTAALAVACLSGRKNGTDVNRLLGALQECGAKITKSVGVSYNHFRGL